MAIMYTMLKHALPCISTTLKWFVVQLLPSSPVYEAS